MIGEGEMVGVIRGNHGRSDWQGKRMGGVIGRGKVFSAFLLAPFIRWVASPDGMLSSVICEDSKKNYF